VYIKPVGAIGPEVIEHWDDIGVAILLKPNMRDISLREKIFGTVGHGTLGMLSDCGCPSRLGGSVTHNRLSFCCDRHL
jgi:hypothetical protein